MTHKEIVSTAQDSARVDRREAHHPAPSQPVTWLIATGLVLLVALLAISVQPLGAQAAPSTSTHPAGHLARETASLTETVTNTVFLPFVVRDWGTYGRQPFGLQIYNAEDVTRERVLGTGTSWVRIPLSWAAIEPVNTTPDNFRWLAAWEAQLAELTRSGVRVILTLGGNPGWAATYPAGPIDKTSLSELAEFMEAVVARYGRAPYNVKLWEFYNEPDNGDEFYAEYGISWFGKNPQAYADILAAVYDPIKSVDPEAQIVLGGIAYDAWDDPWGGPFVKTFLDDVLSLGAGNYFDVMNFHYYLAFAENWEAYGIDILGKLSYLRAKLAEYGLEKPFICTETGMWSDVGNGGSDELQSRYIPQVFARSMAGGLEVVIWFMLQDPPVVETHQWGLIDTQYDPKPSYRAYQTLVEQLSAATFVQAVRADAVMEVYEFQAPGAARTLVAWSNDGGTHDLAVSAVELLLVDKFGAKSTIRDADDGLEDGATHAPVAPSPVYLRVIR